MFLRSSTNPFSKLARALSLSMLTLAFLGACAPKDEPLGGRASRDNQEVSTQELKWNIADRDLDLAHHGLAQVIRARAQLQNALGLRLADRMAARVGDQIQLSETDCRHMEKISPGIERETPAFAERFSITHKCSERVPAESEGAVATGYMTGTERYTVSYDHALPEQESTAYEYEQLTPVSVVVEAMDFDITLKPWNKDRNAAHKYDVLRLNRSLSLTAERIGLTETNLTYRVSVNSRTTFYHDVYLDRRNGELTSSVYEVVFQVDRKSRQVSFVSMGSVRFLLNANMFVKRKPNGATLDKGPRLALNLLLTPVDGLASPSSACSAPEGTYRLSKTTEDDNSETFIQSAGGQISVEDRDTGTLAKPLSLCDAESGGPIFLSEYEGIFF